jgi:outer membrane lipoprotein-sorting protein
MATVQQGDHSPAEILKRLEAELHQLRDYTVTLDVVANLERLSIPPMQLTMYYKAPDLVHFDAKGFALVPREGVPWSPSWLTQRFRAESAQPDTLEGLGVIRLELEPRDDRARTRRVTVWVDPACWTAIRVFTATVDGRMINASFVYARVEGFWLPSMLTLTVSTPPADTTLAAGQTGPAIHGMGGRFRSGTIEVRYSDFHLNTGLSDTLFQSPARKEP